LLVPPADAGALAAALRSLLEHPDGARRLGEFGRQHVAEAFNVDRCAMELAQAFERARPRVPRAQAAFAT
jgi:glycosyltransferase involved in cell wall biosynthesis